MILGNDQHLNLLKQGRDIWNEWKDATRVKPDLRGFDLSGMDLSGYHLDQTDFSDANLNSCNLNDAWLCWCIFIRTDLSNVSMTSSFNDESKIHTRQLGVNLRWSTFAECSLRNVNLRDASMEAVRFYKCDLSGADLSRSDVYGISAWGNMFDENTKQEDLTITQRGETVMTLDKLELAQFVYLSMNSHGIREALTTLTSKVVLILGSFASDDKVRLDSIRNEFRQRNYVPLMYDFPRLENRNHTETVSTLAHLASFVIVDLSNPRSVPHELASIIPRQTSVPFISIIDSSQLPYGMFEDFQALDHVASPIQFNTPVNYTELVDAVIEMGLAVASKVRSKLKET